MEASEKAIAPVSVPRLLVVILFTRTIINTAYRAVYPFLPFIAAGLGVSFQTAAEIVQSRNLIGLLAPLFGPLSDRYGRRTIMFLGLGVSAVACLTLGFLSSFLFAVAAISVIALGKALYDPAQQAYLGDRIPYAERGRAMSFSEISWSAASLAGLPLFGIVVQYAGWRAAFALLGLVGAVMLTLTRNALPGGDGATHQAGGGLWSGSFARIVRQPAALAIVLTELLSMSSNENMNIVFSQWMKSSFLVDAVALGTVAAAMGFAEFSGELFSTGFVDRIGKHRLVSLSLLCAAVTYAALPFIGQNAVLATIGLVLVFFFFEISVVSEIPLVTEVVPSARATLLSLNLGAMALGRTVGSFAGPWVLASGGFMVNALVSAVGTLAACAVWQFLVHEQQQIGM